jgi:hypothetical protein
MCGMSDTDWPTASATVVELEQGGGGVERPVFRFVDGTGATRSGVGSWSFPILYAVGDVVDVRYDPASDVIVEPEVEDRPGVARLLTPEGRRQLEGVPVELAGLLELAVTDRRRKGRTGPRSLSVGTVSPGLRTALAGALVALGFVLLLGRMQLAAFFLIGYGFVLLVRGRRTRPFGSPPPAPVLDSYRSPTSGPVGADPQDGTPTSS